MILPRGTVHEVLDAGKPTTTLVLAWATNPLPMNGGRGTVRGHARKVKAVRETASWLAAIAVPWPDRPVEHLTVHLTQFATVKRNRDADNLVQLMKALVDGFTTAGVIRDDHDGIVHREMPTVVVDPTCTAHFELTITRGTA